MVNKKGYLRTVEAIIALVIILAVVFFAMPRKIQDTSVVPGIVRSAQDVTRQQIMLDEQIKNCIVKEQNDPCIAETLKKIGDIIEKNQPVGFDYAFKVCENPTCLCGVADYECKKPAGKSPSEINSNVYMSDVFISSTVAVAGSTHKIIRFWMWRSDKKSD